MARIKVKPPNTLIPDLPPFAVGAALSLGIDLGDLQAWALRPDGSVVLISGNGMKFVVMPK